MGKYVQCLGHFMNCRENLYILYALPHGGGGGYGENVKVSRPKHQFKKIISEMELF